MIKFKNMCKNLNLEKEQYVIRNRYLPPEKRFWNHHVKQRRINGKCRTFSTFFKSIFENPPVITQATHFLLIIMVMY